jgi:hypothetical protein
MCLCCSWDPGFPDIHNPSKELITHNFLPGSLGINGLLSGFFEVRDLLCDRILTIRGPGSSGSVTSQDQWSLWLNIRYFVLRTNVLRNSNICQSITNVRPLNMNVRPWSTNVLRVGRIPVLHLLWLILGLAFNLRLDLKLGFFQILRL